MKTTITTLALFLLPFCGIQSAHAQTQEQAIKELTKTLQQYDYEVIELTPCKVYIKQEILEGAYVEYLFTPNEAHWEGKDYGLRADWLVIHERKYFNGKATKSRRFVLPFVTDNKEVHSKIAKQINTLAGFCKMELKEKEITDKDLVLFLYTLQDLEEKLAPLKEQLTKDLADYQTDVWMLFTIYWKESKGQSIDNYTQIERDEATKAKPFLKTYDKKSSEIYNEYFESVWAGMPDRQFIFIREKLSSDKGLMERAVKINAAMNN